MTTQIWVNIGSGNGLVPYGTEPLPDLMLILLRAVLQEILKISILDSSLKITNLSLQPHLPGASELNDFIYEIQQQFHDALWWFPHVCQPCLPMNVIAERSH